MCVAEFGDKPLQAQRLFQRIQVLPLDVFDQSDGRRRLVRDVAYQHRYFAQARQTGGAEPPLPCEDFVLALIRPVVQRPHQNGLQHPLGFDALGQFVQSTFVHLRSRLVSAGHHPVDRQHSGRALRVRHVVALLERLFVAWTQQRVQATPEAFGFF